MNKKITIFPVNMGEHFDKERLKQLSLYEDDVHLLVNDIDFFRKAFMYSLTGLSFVKSEYVTKGGYFCSSRGCTIRAKPIDIIDEDDYVAAKLMIPTEDYTKSQVIELLSKCDAPVLIMKEKCRSIGVSVAGIFTERKFRNRLAWIRKKEGLTEKFLEHGLMNEKKVPLCKGILAMFNEELQQTYQEIHYVIPDHEKEIFDNGIIATENVFGLKATITVELYS